MVDAVEGHLISTVCVISDKAFVSGGQAKVAIDTACLLSRSGLRVIFFAAVGPVDPSLAQAGVEVECLGQPDILSNKSRADAMASGLWNFRAARSLSERVGSLDQRSTVLHCHGYAKALSPSIGPVITRGDLPCLFTIHEYFLACPNGGFYDYVKQEICERRPLGFDCLVANCDSRSRLHKTWRVTRQAVTWGPGRMPRGLRDIAYLSRTQLEVMRPYLPESARLHHLPNPVSSAADGRQANPKESSIFLFVGRLNPEKGGRIFAAAAHAAGVRAVFVGEGPERDAILRANPNAELLGWKSSRDVQDIMLSARVLVFPSVWYETFGLVAYEALARGLPVVAGRRNAASEAIVHGRNGIIIERMDQTALAGTLRELASDRHPVFDEVRQCPRDDLGETAYTERLLEIYRGMQDRRSYTTSA